MITNQPEPAVSGVLNSSPEELSKVFEVRSRFSMSNCSKRSLVSSLGKPTHRIKINLAVILAISFDKEFVSKAGNRNCKDYYACIFRSQFM